MQMKYFRRNINTREFWEKKYREYIENDELRSDGDRLQVFRELFEKAGSVVDFGSGLGGNVQVMSEMTSDTDYLLVDHSETCLNYASEQLLGSEDDRGNTFRYLTDMKEIPDASVDLVTSIEVLEHITDYNEVINLLWGKIKPGGTLLISVPVKGIRDRNRQHVNKFTVSSMFRILSSYAQIVHISPRTYSMRSGILSTAYFFVEKNHT
jgi:2-polyprenyl-3-methyl-5-hydroxy-6-metoxy-1,4-benzoquinol methylase